ncbi:MAG: PAS domain-containing protein [Phycisphaerae bacterium]|nr:PAS domain-containing protein [Phycisphaerae bacterium]
MALRKAIFMRVTMLVVLLAVCIAAAFLIFAREHYRASMLELTMGRLSAHEVEINRLLDRDDRGSVKKTLEKIVQSHSEIEYAVIESHHISYVDTFDSGGSGISMALLKKQGVTDVPSVWEFLDSRGEYYYDVAIRFHDNNAYRFHIGLRRSEIDRQMWPLVIKVFVLTIAVILIAISLSYIIAKKTTREVDLQIDELQKKREEPGIRIEKRANDLEGGRQEKQAEITGRKQAEEISGLTEQQYRTVADFTYDWECWVNPAGKFVYVSPSCERITGYPPEAFLENSDQFKSLIHPDDRHLWVEHEQKMCKTADACSLEFRIVDRWGIEHWIGHRCQVVQGEGGDLGRRGSNRDITDRKQVEKEREVMVDLLEVLNAKYDLHGLMEKILHFIKELSGCEAVGIRLQDGDDYPYFETCGFSDEFVEIEKHLCMRDVNGQVKRDASGDPLLDCMCGHVISGRFDASKPFFTDHGSFVSNCTSDLLVDATAQNRLGPARNRCNAEGYESVALFPLRSGGETFGLLQFNDHRKGCFSPPFIALVERLADNVAMALAHRKAEDVVVQRERSLHDSLKEKEVLLREIHHRVKNNMQVIVSLLRMHARRSQNERMQSVFDDCRNRVNAMALIHEALYESADMARINFEVYLKKLCRNMSQAYRVSDKHIEVNVVQCDVTLDMDQGIAVGMVISELISNAFKHAYPAGKEGVISVSLASRSGQKVELVVWDNGVGLSPDIDIYNLQSLGLQLVVATVMRELNGSIEVERNNGTRFVICFEYTPSVRVASPAPEGSL